ncbi:sodium-dependent bicarbonate transport family permease [Parasphingorhabdus halotolerans]|uniref:Sodium-dependent bicarbonate transport family permease n=1 Tax=Parasphingorhabdus halotolerans TaxID=2725558 RepID=A0A6H2DJU3_9SPHN|nr:sodium-dependent bicarbonate transport family permease [Parasphingorhabdus halotolerans]QJB68215.1 sodium-dependent bicarbonate transport family permease [Parasphingorhabdus halotolerans]
MSGMIIETLTSPVILFFILGFFAACIRSDLTIPEPFAKAMSIYLMAAIGLKGGVEVASTGFTSELASAAIAGILLGFTLPILAFFLLRSVGKLGAIDSGAVAAHYGSVSVVTFVTAVELLTKQDMEPDGFMVGVMALMETPAIITGLLLARAYSKRPGLAEVASTNKDSGYGLLHEVLTNGSVVLLMGAFAIGMVAGEARFEPIKPLFAIGFNGVLCLFLLDMGLLAARRLLQSKKITIPLALLAILMPIINGTIGVAVGTLIGLEPGSAAILGVLCASASYIAVPAAMRLAMPQADPGIYLSMSLGITFPFNIIFGISLFAAIANFLG